MIITTDVEALIITIGAEAHMGCMGQATVVLLHRLPLLLVWQRLIRRHVVRVPRPVLL